MSDPLKVPKTMQQIFAEVSQCIEEFCGKHLNEEYALVSRAGSCPGRSIPSTATTAWPAGMKFSMR